MSPRNSANYEPSKNPDVLFAPRAVLDDVRKRANRENKRKNLDLLWDVLLAIKNEGGRDYSLAEIGRRLELIGGPKTQSLRNSGGADFREVINSFVVAVHGSTRYIAKAKSNVEQALEWISDPTVRAILSLEIATAKKLHTENANLRNAISRLSAPISTDLTPNPDTEDTGIRDLNEDRSLPNLVSAEEATFQYEDGFLSRDLIQVLKTAVDPLRIQKLGFTVQDDGSITNLRGDLLFPAGFVTACVSVTERF